MPSLEPENTHRNVPFETLVGPKPMLEVKRFLATQEPNGTILLDDPSPEGDCPSVIETNRGSFVVVGNKLSQEEQRAITSKNHGVHSHEDAVEISAELLRAALSQLDK